MTDWTDTAKRLAAHPRFKWLEWMLAVPEFEHGEPYRVEKVEHELPWYAIRGHYPDLTDWPTVGVLLGMCFEEIAKIEAKGLRFDQVTRVFDGLTDFMFAYEPGDAKFLAELWLELVGEG